MLLPCILWPFVGVSKLTSCASSCRRMLWCLTLRFASPPPHIFLRAAQQHPVDRRGAAAYGDAHLLSGKPKMLISALPLAPFLLSPEGKLCRISRSVQHTPSLNTPQPSITSLSSPLPNPPFLTDLSSIMPVGYTPPSTPQEERCRGCVVSGGAFSAAAANAAAAATL